MKLLSYIQQHSKDVKLPDGNIEVETYLQSEGLYANDSNFDVQMAEAKLLAFDGKVTVVDIPMTAEEARAQRDKMLLETDWTQVLDAPIDADTREAYRAYRQALRDIPEQERFPEVIVWPALPAKVKAAPEPVDEAVELLLSGATGEEAAT